MELAYQLHFEHQRKAHLTEEAALLTAVPKTDYSLELEDMYRQDELDGQTADDLLRGCTINGIRY